MAATPVKVIELDRAAKYKIGTTPPFLAAVVAFGIQTAVMVLTQLESSKVRIFSVSNWQWIELAEIGVGLTLISITLVWGKYMPNVAGSDKTQVYTQHYWNPYLVSACISTVVAMYNFSNVMIQYQTYGNRLDLSDFSGANCSVSGIGLTGCQFDAAETLSQWFTVNKIHGALWVIQILAIAAVIPAEWNPEFTPEYIERRTDAKRLVRKAPLDTGDDSDDSSNSD